MKSCLYLIVLYTVCLYEILCHVLGAVEVVRVFDLGSYIAVLLRQVLLNKIDMRFLQMILWTCLTMHSSVQAS